MGEETTFAPFKKLDLGEKNTFRPSTISDHFVVIHLCFTLSAELLIYFLAQYRHCNFIFLEVLVTYIYHRCVSPILLLLKG